MKGGTFDITLIGPASDSDERDWAEQIAATCDRFVPWRRARSRPRWMRALDLLGALPVNVAADRTAAALKAVEGALVHGAFDVAVFDFVHAAVLLPSTLEAATVCFTHNVEAEIFARHAEQATNLPMRLVWASQHAKMERFEREALRRFTSVVAVSERDAKYFREQYEIAAPATIPTGVDLDFFAWNAPQPVGADRPPTVAFIGSMDWDANIDGVRHFLDAVWPLVQSEVRPARFVVIGRNPPAALLDRARALTGVSFTGFVDDVRPIVREAHVSVIPLRVGGGTRIKAFEAMAMGCPVVSTSIGIEGLDVADGEHYLRCDSAADQASAVVRLLRDATLREQLSRRARQCVESRFGHRVAAQAFEQACLLALAAHRGRGGIKR